MKVLAILGDGEALASCAAAFAAALSRHGTVTVLDPGLADDLFALRGALMRQHDHDLGVIAVPARKGALVRQGLAAADAVVVAAGVDDARVLGDRMRLVYEAMAGVNPGLAFIGVLPVGDDDAARSLLGTFPAAMQLPAWPGNDLRRLAERLARGPLADARPPVAPWRTAA